MRRWFLLGVLAISAACGASKAKGPAWPEPSTTAEDGGESLAPRETSVAAIEKSESKASEPEEEKPAETETTVAAEPDETKLDAPAATGSDPITDEVIISDEIIIEIED